MEADSKLLSLVKGNPASHLNNNNSNTDNTNATQQIQNGSPICPIKIKEEPVYDQSSSPPPSNTVGNVLTASSSNIHGSNVASLPTEVANGYVSLMPEAPNSIQLTVPTQAANNLNTLISSSPGSIQPTQVGSGFLALISNAPNSVLPTASTPVVNNSPALISSATDGDGQSNGGDGSLPPVRIGTCLLCGNEMCGKGVTCASDDEDDNNDDDDDDAKRDFLPAPPMSSVEVDKLFSNLIEQDKETQMEPTAVISTEMYVHQKQALQWMVNRENSNDLGPFWKETTRGDWFNEGTWCYTDERPKCINGGILADDMGLGKTLTIIALIFTNHINGKPLFLKKESATARKRNASVDAAQGPTAPQSKKPCIVISSDESDGKGKKPMKVKKEKDVAAIKKRKEGLMNSKRIKESKKGKDAGEKFRKLFLPTFMKKKNKEEKIVKKEKPTKQSPAEKPAKQDVSSPSTSHGSTILLDDDIDDDLIIEPVTKQPTINTPMKTIDIVSTNPTNQNVAKATLIICPLSVLSNWTDQICTHVNPAVTLRVYLYYGPQRIKDIEYLKKQDMVLTTYPTIANDYSKSIRSPLHKIKWLRIILDEGHTIRNKRTTLAKAALELEGERRWVITGTPIQNRIDDLWVLLLFLRLEPFNDKKWWKTMIANILQKRRLAELADFRLNTLIKHISIRRLKDEKVNNSKLVELPPKQVVIQDIELSEDERKLYDMLQLEGQKILRRYIKEDSVIKHYGHCFFIILRLRQMCLIPRLCKETLTELREALDRAQQDDNNADDQDDSNAHLIKVLMEAISAGDSEECTVCLESLSDPVITSCAHVFCSACIKDVINGHAPTCPMCRGPITEAELVRVPEEQLREMNGEIENDDGGGDETHFEGSAKLTFKRRNSGTRADHKREPIPQSWGSKGERSETISLKPSLRFNQKFIRNRTERIR